jgi:spermidine synthase
VKTHGGGSPAAPAAPEPLVPAGLRVFLYVAAGVTGAAVMMVEILGARILAPWVGTSHFVWTAQIAVTLAALAAGYAAGGRLSGRGARPGVLFAGLLVAAAWLACTVVLREATISALLALPLPACALLSSALLFFVPLGLMAMTGPFLVSVLAGSLRQAGATAGRLSAVSTLGSFLGTAVIGYVLVPLLPNSVTLLGTAAVVAAVALVYFAAWRRTAARLVMVLALVGAGAAAAAAGLAAEGLHSAGLTELWRASSSFGQLQVVQVKGTSFRYALDDYLIQDAYDVAQKKSTAMFTYMLEGLARSYTARLDSVLCIGMGVGIVPRELAAAGARVDVVEINPAMTAMGRQWFDLDPSVFSLTVGDGRTYLRTTNKRYDAVLLDAFIGDSSPSHLMTREAFTEISRALNPGGVLVINTFVDFADRKDYMGTSLWKTLSAVFPSVRSHGAHDANTLFVASMTPGLEFLRQPELSGVHSAALAGVREAYGRAWTPDLTGGIVLTDDFNPLEYFDAAKRERYRRTLARSLGGT